MESKTVNHPAILLNHYNQQSCTTAVAHMCTKSPSMLGLANMRHNAVHSAAMVAWTCASGRGPDVCVALPTFITMALSPLKVMRARNMGLALMRTTWGGVVQGAATLGLRTSRYHVPDFR